MILKEAALKVTLSLTCVALMLGSFMAIIWQVQLLAESNQLIYLLGALVAAALTWLYLRCLVTLLD